MTLAPLVLSFGLLAQVPEAQELTLLFTGDNIGEVSPCGCANAPAGGLARRKSVLSKEQALRPTLTVDAGNALFAHPGILAGNAKERAAFILRTMGALGTQAMAVGTRDLNAGVDFLRKTAQSAGVTLVSANLRDEQGRLIFPASTEVNVKGVRVAVVGVSQEGAIPGTTSATGGKVELAVDEVSRVSSKVDVVLVLASMPYEAVLALAQKLPAKVGAVIFSHEARGAGRAMQVGSTYVMPSGDRGRQVGKLTFHLGQGQKPWTDSSELEREKSLLQALENKWAILSERLGKTKNAEARAVLQPEVQALVMAKKRHEEAIKRMTGPAERRFRLDWITLGADVEEEPSVRAAAVKFGPSPP